MQRIDLATIGLRKLRMALAVEQSGRFSEAAERLGVTQPAVTRAVASLEQAIGALLFNRTTAHVATTDVGDVVLRRATRTFELLGDTDDHGDPEVQSTALSQASEHELRSLLATFAKRSIVAAAHSLGVSQPAVSRSLLTLERRLGCRLYRRTVNGLKPEPETEALVRRVKLAFSELRQAADDLDALAGRRNGRLTIGALPLARSELVPLAVLASLMLFPEAEITILDGTWDSLAQGLRDGDVDIIVGSVRTRNDDPDLVIRALFEDNMAIVAANDHPLAKLPEVDIDKMLAYQWVLPLPEVPLRQQFESLISNCGGVLKNGSISTDSMDSLQSLLLNSDRLGLVAHHQVRDNLRRGMLAVLPLASLSIRRVVGLTMRRSYHPTALFNCFLNNLVSTASPEA